MFVWCHAAYIAGTVGLPHPLGDGVVTSGDQSRNELTVPRSAVPNRTEL